MPCRHCYRQRLTFGPLELCKQCHSPWKDGGGGGRERERRRKKKVWRIEEQRKKKYSKVIVCTSKPHNRGSYGIHASKFLQVRARTAFTHVLPIPRSPRFSLPAVAPLPLRRSVAVLWLTKAPNRFDTVVSRVPLWQRSRTQAAIGRTLPSS